MAGKHRLRRVDYTFAMQLYDEGKTDQEIADTMGAQKRTISAWRAGLGLIPHVSPDSESKPKKKKERQLTPLERDLQDAREAGLTYGQYKAQRYLEQQKKDLQLSALRRKGGAKK